MKQYVCIDKFGLENGQIRLSEFIIKVDREQIKRNCFENRTRRTANMASFCVFSFSLWNAEANSLSLSLHSCQEFIIHSNHVKSLEQYAIFIHMHKIHTQSVSSWMECPCNLISFSFSLIT